MSSVARPDHAAKSTLSLATADENHHGSRQTSFVTLKSPTRSVTIRTGTYDVRAKVFQTDMPFDYRPYRIVEDGLFARVNDGKPGEAFVFFSVNVLRSMIDSGDKPRKKEMLAFAEAHYDVFAKIISDMNTKDRNYSWTKELASSFFDDHECMEIDDNGDRIYLYDRL